MKRACALACLLIAGLALAGCHGSSSYYGFGYGKGYNKSYDHYGHGHHGHGHRGKSYSGGYGGYGGYCD